MKTTSRIVLLLMIFVLTTCKKEFVNRDFPSVFTLSAVPNEDETIILSGNMIWRNSGEIREEGFVWQVDDDPIQKPGFKINLGTKINSGNFQAEISSSLKKGSKYEVRAYALSGNIKTYGEEVEFVPGSDLPVTLNKFEPITGHAYDTITITGGRFNSTISLNQVKFDDLSSRIVAINDTVIKCIVPYGIKSNSTTIVVIVNGIEGTFTEGFTPIIDPVPSDGLLAYYPFNGNANDESGNFINGSVHGASLTYDRFNVPNSAYSFNGTNNYISLFPSERFIGLNNYSISLWVMPTNFPSNTGEMIIASGSASSPYVQGISYITNTSTFFVGSYNIGNNPVESYSSSCCYETNKWVHIALTRDNTYIKIYINGILITPQISSLTNNQDVNYGTYPFAAIIGGRSNLDPNFFFKGIIDEVRIYNRTLSDSEITKLANQK